jgi:hypothetical protein
MMVFGAIAAAYDDLAFDLYGYVYIMLNNFFTAANGIYSKQNFNTKKLNEFENLSVEKDFYKVLNKYCKDIRLVRNDEKKQKILQSIIDRIDVIWLDEYKRHFVEIKYKFDEVNNFLLNRQLNVKYKPNGNSFKLLGTEKIKFEIQYNNFNKRNEDLKGNDFKSSLVYEG